MKIAIEPFSVRCIAGESTEKDAQPTLQEYKRSKRADQQFRNHETRCAGRQSIAVPGSAPVSACICVSIGLETSALHSAGIQPSHLRVLALCFSALAPLSDTESDLLRGLAGAAPSYPPFQDLGATGMPPRMIVAGWAAQCRQLANGRRHIVSLRLPGDFVWPLARLPLPSTCAVSALTELEAVDAQPLVDTLAGPAHPNLAHSLRTMAHLDHMLLVEQIVRLGRTTAAERFAHLMLELHERLGRVGLADEGCFAMPLAPEVLADALGLSVVHVNRTVQQLGRRDLLEVRDGRVTLMQRKRLQALAGWTPAWLPDR